MDKPWKFPGLTIKESAELKRLLQAVKQDHDRIPEPNAEKHVLDGGEELCPTRSASAAIGQVCIMRVIVGGG